MAIGEEEEEEEEELGLIVYNLYKEVICTINLFLFYFFLQIFLSNFTFLSSSPFLLFSFFPPSFFFSPNILLLHNSV